MIQLELVVSIDCTIESEFLSARFPVSIYRHFIRWTHMEPNFQYCQVQPFIDSKLIINTFVIVIVIDEELVSLIKGLNLIQ